MSHSFISYGRNQIRLHDSDITVAVFLMNLVCKEKAHLFSKEITAAVADWVTSVVGAPPGMADFGFDEYEKESELKILLDESFKQLVTFGEKIPKSFLNDQMSTEREIFPDDYPAKDVEKTLSSLQNLL